MKFDGCHLLRAPDFDLEPGPYSVSVDGTTIRAVARSNGAASRVLLPALVNAHDHGYGLRTLGIGAADDALECWIPGLANRPETDPQLEAQVAFGRMALAGIGTTVHCHNAMRRDRLQTEADGVAAAARAVGIRIAFSCPISDRNPVVYGDPAALAGCGYPKELLEQTAAGGPDGREQIENALAVRERYQSEIYNVQLGPIGPQWCSDRTLEAIARASADTGMRIHMHLLETERQREWLDHAYDRDPVGWLDRMGLLSPRLTVAHGVWLRPDECETLAERGVTVAVNSSSNLRLRSGIAPVGTFRTAGLAFAVGLDGGAFDDDQDMLREIRLFKRLQSGMGLADGMSPAEAFRAALQAGFRVFDGSTDYGPVAPGARADILVIDTARIARDRVDDAVPLADLVFARACGSDVTSLVVAGRPVVQDGRLVEFDLEAAERQLLDMARAATGPAPRHSGETRSRREAIRTYYGNRHHLT